METISLYTIASPYGPCTVAIEQKYIFYIGFGADAFHDAVDKLLHLDPIVGQGPSPIKWHDIKSRNPTFRYYFTGTPFQHTVWAYIRTIPAGTTTTYKAIACALSNPNAARAVGKAVGANLLAFYTPRHRVVPLNGSLGNYRWGSEIKKKMLRNEGVEL